MTNSTGAIQVMSDLQSCPSPVAIPGTDPVEFARALLGRRSGERQRGILGYQRGQFGSCVEDSLNVTGQSGIARFVWTVHGYRNRTSGASSDALVSFSAPIDETHIIEIPFVSGDRIPFSVRLTLALAIPTSSVSAYSTPARRYLWSLPRSPRPLYWWGRVWRR